MKSMQVVEFGQALVQNTSGLPPVNAKQVLLKVKAAGVCHTDVHLWQGGYDLGHGRRLKMADRGVQLPLTMGHETVGEVIAVGAEVLHTKVGDVRLVYPWIGCGTCEVCLHGQENYCLRPATLGINQPGGYADHILVPDEKYTIAIDTIDPIQAAPLACSGLTCYSALRKFDLSRIQRQPIVVFGAGGLGLMFITLLKALGGQAIIVEPDVSRRQAALAVGASAAFDANEAQVQQQITQYLGGPAYDAIDFVANESTAELAFNLLTRGGHLVVIGLFGGAAPWPLPLIATKALTIQGSYVGSLQELNELVELVKEKAIPLIPVKTCGLHQVQQALEDLEAGVVVGRMVMTPTTD